ncbi:uncharacterized protein LOC135535770 isoform X3 [Oncorhynchus masou masou]|uniref:uncharacterized protein LOC135535770 isoform X3 n=1 Tax=Oncorhynchus masou masou TaxID=90313 RepID=UPI0031841404
MASTRQSALEYITNGRLRLIGRLQNLPLILENLFQRKVLHEEEVSKIQAEVDHFDQTRKILDWVSAKGEAACYELLMILDITRKRTLGDADLQQWISCFPFEGDPEMTDYLVGSKPCQRYQTQLKCKARKITEGAWTQSCSLLPERCRNDGTFSYTPLVLDTDVCSSLSKIKMKNKRCKKARPKKLKSFIPLAKQQTSPADLLKTYENKILLVGKPGIGKTTVAHQMLNLWAEKDHRELDYMFYFYVRDISHKKPMSLEDLLFNMYSEPNESKEEVLQDIKKNSENIVIIFDGITDTDLSFLSVVKDLVENLLPDAKIVTTCRPDQSEDFLTDWPTDWFRVEVKGFSDESIRAYLTQMLSAEPDSLSSVLNNLELFSLCHVPMYALMVVAGIYFPTSEASKQTCTITEMYSNIFHHCIQKHSGKRLTDIDNCLKENREKILSLAEIAFDATNEKNMNLTTLSCEESSVHFAFLGALMVNVSPTESDTYSAFLHYTMQEFFGALWLLQNPDKIREVLEKCPTEEWKHTKHLIPFLCGLLNEKNIKLVNSLVPALQIKKTSDWFSKEVVNTFLPSQTNQDHAEGGAPEFEIDLLFLCQCLYEYQSTEACQLFLDKLNYHLDLSGEHLDPHQCCAVSYVTSQSAERKVGLDLNGCTVSDQGVRLILGSLKNVRHLGPSSDDSSDPSMLCQLWKTLLSSEAEMDFTSLLGICGNELHLPVQGEGRVFERAEEVMTQSLERVHLCVHWDQRTVLSEALSKTILKCLPNINKLRFTPLQHQRGSPERLETEEKAVLLDLCLQAALDHRETFQRIVNTLLSLFSVYQTERYDILLDLYSHVKYNRNQTARSILPSLKPVYQSAPAVWSIDLSERKASLLLEVLKLQPGKKPVELKGWSDEESEVRSFLQCLPYISQLRFSPLKDNIKRRKREKTFLLNLCLQAALHERGTIQTTVEKMLSLSKVYHNQKCDFLLDLYSHVKDYETQTGSMVLPALQPVYQSAPAVWSIDLSERKASLLLEVLKLQPEKKPVELKGWSDEESEVRSFLQCLSHISQLSFTPTHDQRRSPEERTKREKTFLLNMCLQAAHHERGSMQTTVEKMLSLSKVYHNQKCDFLMDLYSHVKDYETQTGRSFLPALQPVYQSAPAVWSIDLSERKASLLLEVLKLQPGKKPVELKGWSDEESEVRSFLQCLPYISQLRFSPLKDNIKRRKREKTFLLNLCLQAALHERGTIQTTVEKMLSLSKVYHNQKCDFLLDLYSHVKDYETQTGSMVLPALQPVYQSAPAVWSIDLSERKASLLLEVLKLQPEKKPVELKGWSDEESEVRSFLQCLPYISQLSFHPWWSDPSKQIKFLVDLLSQAAEWEEQTGEKTLKLVSSVWTYSTFPYRHGDDYEQSDFLLDLYSHVKDSETQTGRSFLPALQPVYQSAPAVWSIDLSKRKASLLLEVLKLQPEKKPVELRGWSDEESEVRSFLQCLPYISQLRLFVGYGEEKAWTVLSKLSVAAAEFDTETGENILKTLSSMCRYTDDDDGNPFRESDFLMDLYSHVKDYETQTGRSVLPALQPVYQSAPAVWSIDLSERKASLLLEVLKLQPEKKPVELRGWSDEESEVRSFLQCLPYISQLSCDDDRFFQTVCESIPVRSREEDQQLASLLQALGSTLSLGGVLPRKTCRSVGRVLGFCASRVDLTLTPSKISLQGAALLLRHESKLHKLRHVQEDSFCRLNLGMAVKLSRLVRRTGRGSTPLTVPELFLVLKSSQPPEIVLSRALSSVASLLRFWRVQCLDLTDFCIQRHSLITLLCHQGPLSLRLNSDTLQQLTVVVYEAQDKDLAQWFLEKVGGDLTSCRLDWEVLLSLLQHSTHNITVDLRKNRLLEKNSSDLLPFLGRVTLKRSSSSFVKSSIRQIYDSRASDCVSSLLRSSDHWINLNSRELDRVDCTALCFTLQHSHQVKVNLLWTSIPPGEIESILPLLDRVSQLSVDRRLLLSFLQCCAASQIQQGAPSSPPTAVWLLRSLHYRLDFSCSSSVDLSAQDQGEALCLTTDHCRAIHSVLKQNQHSTQLVQNQVQLILRDCEVEDRALRELLPILHIVKLSPSKALLLQLLDLVCEGIQEGLLRHAESLCRALDGELDLSETRLDQKACGSLALVLEHSEGLSELDLSHCQLTDHQLQPLITHLHKVQVLDLSHNDITDALTDRILQLVSTNTSIHTVRLFNNRIQDRRPFLTDKRFDIW